MRTSSLTSTNKERKTAVLPVKADTSSGKVIRTRVSNAYAGGNTGTFVYLKTRRGMKSGSTQKANEEWKPRMWTYLR